MGDSENSVASFITTLPLANAEKFEYSGRDVYDGFDWYQQKTAEYKVRGAYISLSHTHEVHDTENIDGFYLNVRMMSHVKSIDMEYNIKVWKAGSAVKVLNHIIRHIFEKDEGIGNKGNVSLPNIPEVAIILTVKKWVIEAK